MKKKPDFSIYSNLKQPQLQNCDSSNTTTHVNYNMPKSKKLQLQWIFTNYSPK